ncbi:hypothetical protein RRG08_051834 [Elysia crispata]|uniref:Uncharacterized protein n=1 Tax=Elysia crispata TaxID=231223 RepID=A0AAE1DCS5_9GAST|nr:hypothetical protein RRG08_051834 [Elysia crispata]
MAASLLLRALSEYELDLRQKSSPPPHPLLSQSEAFGIMIKTHLDFCITSSTLKRCNEEECQRCPLGGPYGAPMEPQWSPNGAPVEPYAEEFPLL